MGRKKVPKRLWDFGLVYQSEIISRMARGKNGRSGYKEVTGETPTKLWERLRHLMEIWRKD